MSIYHWLVILIILLSVLLRGNRKQNTTYIVIVFLLMFCIQGLRDAAKIGNDSRVTYRDEFHSMGARTWEDLGTLGDWANFSQDSEEMSGQNRNVALRWMMKLVYDWTDGDYQWFIAIVAVIVLTAEAVLIQKYSPSPVQSTLYYLGLLYFLIHMSTTKQAMAMSFVLLSFIAIIDKKPLRFILLVLFASMFHFPAIIFLPAYLIANLRIGKGYLLFLMGIFVFTYLFRERLVVLMNDAYYSSEMDLTSDLRFLANKVVVMLAIIAASLVIRPPQPEDRIYCALLQFTGIAAVIQTFAGYDNVFERLADYYFQFSVLLIPMVFDRTGIGSRYRNSEIAGLACELGPYLFGGFAIWRFLDIITRDEHYSPFYFFFS